MDVDDLWHERPRIRVRWQDASGRQRLRIFPAAAQARRFQGATPGARIESLRRYASRHAAHGQQASAVQLASDFLRELRQPWQT